MNEEEKDFLPEEEGENTNRLPEDDITEAPIASSDPGEADTPPKITSSVEYGPMRRESDKRVMRNAFRTVLLALTLIVLVFSLFVAVKILLFRIDITEKAEAKIDKNKFKIKRFRRRRDKVLKKYKIKTAGKPKENKTDDSNESSENLKKATPKNKLKNPRQLISKISALFGEMLKVFPRYLHIEFKKLIIGVGGKDAADIAIKTGAVMQSVQYLVTYLEGLTNVKKLKGGQVYVYPVFVEGKWSAEVDISAYIRFGNVLRLGILFIKNYIKYKAKKK